MGLPSFDLLEYLERSWPRCAYDLASSDLPPMSLGELGPLEDLDLSESHVDGSPELRQAVAREAGVDPEEVLVTAGASEANLLVGLALLERRGRVLVESPAYEPLGKTFQLLGARVDPLPRPFAVGFRPDLDALDAADLGPGDLLVLTNLHNPGGTLLERAALEALARRAEAGGFPILVDEIYREAAFERPPPCARTVSEAFVVTSGLSKVYGLGGLRIGWCLAGPEVRERVRACKALASVAPSVVSEALALRALAQADGVRARNRWLVAANRKRVEAWVEAQPRVDWVPPDGFVSFPRYRGDVDRLATRALERHGVLVAPGRLFGAPDHFRLCFGRPPEEVEGGLEALGHALEEA